MANKPPKTPYDSWQQQRCHPNAPAGGGGPGCFTSADPFRFSNPGWQRLPHPDSPAARYLTSQEIRTPALTERVQAVVEAYLRALRLAPAAVYRETGCQLDQVIDGLLPGLLQMLAALGICGMAGASAGAAVGFFLGGVGAAPGAIVGGELGLEAGTALLAWMGLGFLAAAIGQGMGELTGVLRRAVRCAWYAPEHHFPSFETDRAAEDLARAAGILFRLILQGLLAYVLKNGAVSASQAAASTGRTIISGGTRTAADATLAEVSALLRQSKLPDGFVVWLEKNWDDLKRNPKLTSPKTTTTNNEAAASAAQTPSQLKGAGNKVEPTRHPGLHNQKWADNNGVEISKFKTISRTDVENLSAEEKIAAASLREQGWGADRIEQVLKSGENFRTKELQPGDKLYGFTSVEYPKDIKTSAYWLDEPGYKQVKSKFFNQGSWDREGVKNYLALPCFNKADAIDMAEVTQPTTVVEAKIGRATELIQYTDDSGYTTGLLGKIMPGGGTQITPAPTTLKPLPRF